jgi:hypothetical protein
VSAVGDDELSDESESKLSQNLWTPLHYACRRDFEEVVSVLLSAGAAVEARDPVSAVGDDEMSVENESDSL